MESAVSLVNVNKSFYSNVKGKTFIESIKNFVIFKKEEKQIIKNLSFSIKEGELVGFIGENGAGKSTTIKMLTGIYPPTSGKINCLGLDPFENRIDYVKDIGVVFGNRSLLNYDIAPKYSLELFGSIYGLSDLECKERYTEFAKRLKVEHLVDTPVRKLSLGERMKFEIIASLLHRPKIVFLDEPTIGLDVISREEMIHFLKEINQKYNTTIMLTTHNMDDIEELCTRIIILQDGQKIYDGSLDYVKRTYANFKKITLLHSKEYKKFKKLEANNIENNLISLNCPNDKLKEVLNELMDCYEIEDLKIEEADLKDIVKRIYVDGSVKDAN